MGNSFSKLVTNPVALKTCAMAQVSLMKDKKTTLENIVRGIESSQHEMESASNYSNRIDISLLALKWVKASCDVTIAIAAEWPPLHGATKNVILGIYNIGTGAADIGAKAVVGTKNDDLVKDAGSVASGLLSTSKLAGSKSLSIARQAKIAGKAKGVVAEVPTKIVNDALNNNEADLTVDVFVGMGAEIGSLASEAAGKKGVGTFFSISKAITEAAIAFVKARDEYKKARAENEETKKSLSKLLTSQANMIKQKIRDLHKEIDSCDISEDAEIIIETPRIP
jgi:hypothetical protein